MAQAALALWVILAQPRRLLNWSVGALLLLWAGSGVVFQLMREAPDAASYVLFNRVGSIYEAPTLLFMALIADQLLLRHPRPRWRAALLAATGLAVLAILAGIALGPTTTDPIPGAPGGTGWRFSGTGTLVTVLHQFVGVGVMVLVVFLAARCATSPERSPLQRRQAALVGLAFGLLVALSGADKWANVALGIAGPTGFPEVLPHVAIAAGLPVALYALLALPKPFRGGARHAVAGMLLLALAAGAASVAWLPVFGNYGVRVVFVTGFALVLGVAVLRYDLADRGGGERRRVHRASAALLALSGAAVLAGAVASLAGPGSLSLAAVLLASLAPLALLAAPVRGAPEWLARRVLLPGRDPDVLRERVRVYASRLQQAAGADGQVPRAHDEALADLRLELGLSARDHELLQAMEGQRLDRRALVAYRLALEGAAGNGEEAWEAPELARLREELGVSAREHALVVEDLQRGGPALAEGALFLGRYRVVRSLSAGGLAEVWLAHDKQRGRDVVLKRLAGEQRRDARALRRFRRELRMASALEHDRIVAVHDVAATGDDLYVVMEYLAGGSLADALRARGRLPEDEVVAVGLDVLGALEALHARGIVHRDVKPGNILLDAQGRAKLGDFTVAREVVSGDTVGPDGARAPVGTFAYMAPEQARGLAARPEADQYGLAATMYEAVSGAPSVRVDGLSHVEAAARVAGHAPVLPVPNASPRLSGVLARALSKVPEDRYADAAAMAAALRRGAPPAGTPAGSAPRPRRPRA